MWHTRISNTHPCSFLSSFLNLCISLRSMALLRRRSSSHRTWDCWSEHGRKAEAGRNGSSNRSVTLHRGVTQSLSCSQPRYPSLSLSLLLLIFRFLVQPASARGIGIRVVNRWSQIPKKHPVIVQRCVLPYPFFVQGWCNTIFYHVCLCDWWWGWHAGVF